MHLAVIDDDADVAGVGTRQRTFVHLLHDAFQDGRHEAGVDRASDDRRIELQFAAPGQVVLFLALDVYRQFSLAGDLVALGFGHAFGVRLDQQVHLAELTRASRLFLVAVVRLGYLGDGFAVGDLRGDVIVLELVLRGDARAQDVQVVFALALDDGLFELLGVVHQDSRIFVFGVVQELAQFFVVGLVLGLNRRTVAGFGEDDRVDRDGRSGRRERVVGARALELHRAADVAGGQFGDLDAILARDGEELRELLLVARAGIQEFHAFGELAPDDAQVGYFADVLFELAFEDERYGRSRFVGPDLLSFGREEGGGLQRAGRYVDDELHQALGADVALGAAAEYGHDRPTGYADFQARADVVLRQCALLEIEFHQGVVVFGGCFDQLLVQSLGLLRFFGRDVELFAGAVLILEAVHFHQQYVDESIESRARIDRILDYDGLHARGRTDGFERSVERCLVRIELIDESDERLVQYTGVTGLDLAAYLPAVLGIEDHDTHVRHLEGREEASAEIVRSRTVYDVELALHEFGEEDGRIDRALVLVLDIRVVRERVVRLDTTPAVDDLTLKSHRFGKGSFSRAGSADKNDVLDFFR